VLEDYAKKPAKSKNKADKNSVLQDELATAAELAKKPSVDKAFIDELLKNPNGVALPLSQSPVSLEKIIAAAPRVENRVPADATWNGAD
jgi:hypothetical protein